MSDSPIPFDKKIALQKGEEILWKHHVPAKAEVKKNPKIPSFLLFLLIFITVVTLLASGSILFLIFPLGFFILYKILHKAFSFEETKLPALDYVFTNKRLFLTVGHRSEIPLEDIESVLISRSYILINGKDAFGQSTQLAQIERIPNLKRAKYNIEKILQKHGAFSQLDRTFAELAFKLRLNHHSTLLDDTDKELKLEGTIGQLKIQYSISPYGRNGSYLDLKIRFPNPNDYYLCLSPETSMSSFAKNAGLGDLEVGESKFDKQFYIQTNNAPQSLKILDPELQEHLYKLYQKAHYTTCQVGTYVKPVKLPKEKKQQFKDDKNVLDMHLVTMKKEEPRENSRLVYDKKRRSDLIFSSRYDIPTTKMTPQAKLAFESFLALVKKL